MASAPTITPKKRSARNERPLIPGEIDSTPDDYPDTGIVSQQKCPVSGLPFRLVRRKCYAWNDPSTFFGRSFSGSLFQSEEAFKFGRTVPSCTNQLKRFSVFEMQEDNRDTGEKAAFHAVTKESCETDGHNTDIKSRRESAMRAGEPSACITPDSEAQAQLRGVAFLIPSCRPPLSLKSEVKVGS
jgi:hypothetical protein